MKKIIAALHTAFPYTLPIMLGFLFLGMSYGVLMSANNYPIYYPTLTSILIFAGSLEFVCVNLLHGLFNPLEAFMIALIVNARHLFYGISLLKKYKNLGLKKIYMIYALCDESFSLNYSIDIPKDIDKGWFMFFITLLNQSYWVFGVTCGAILGSLINIPTKGLEFVMTAMFLVILIEQVEKTKNYLSAGIGIIATLLSLLIFGKERFLIVAMILITFLLYISKDRMVKHE